jgi:transcriptional regulator with XRE-family HTH domain
MAKQRRTFDYSQLRDARIRQGYSLRDVAKSAGVAASTVLRMENGADTSFTAVVRIANALGYAVTLRAITEAERRAWSVSAPPPAARVPSGQVAGQEGEG